MIHFGPKNCYGCLSSVLMTHLVVIKRAFHQAHRGSLLAENRSKRAKDVIKAVHESSLTSKEQMERSADDENSSLPAWKAQKIATSKKLKGQRWNPPKKLSREEMEGVRLIKTQFPQLNVRQLGQQFKVSPEVVRRILSSKWRPTEEEMDRLHDRWRQRGERIKQMFDLQRQQQQQKPLAIPKRIVINTLGSSSGVVASTRCAKREKKNKKSKSKLHLLQQQSEHDHDHSE